MLPETICPYCGYKLDAAINLEDGMLHPKPNDFSICIKCAGILKFDNNLKTVELNSTDIKKLTNEERNELSKYKMAILTLNHEVK